MPKRRKIWVPFTTTFTIVVGTELLSTNLLANSPLTGSNSACTILRMVGSMNYKTDTVGVRADTIAALGVFNDSVSATTTPNPVSEPYDWMWWRELHSDGRTTEDAAGVFSPWFQEVTFDVRSMRILKANYGLFAKWSGSNVDDIVCRLALRTLVALP